MNPQRVQIFTSHWFAAPAELVFRAFVEPALLEQWFCPAAEVALRVEHCDARIGGQYKFVFYFPDGRVVPVVGQYQVVEPPNRLVFSWTWVEPDPWAGVVTLVSIQFLARAGGTDVQVEHSQLPTAELGEMHESGWRATLERLDPLLAHSLQSEGTDSAGARSENRRGAVFSESCAIRLGSSGDYDAKDVWGHNVSPERQHALLCVRKGTDGASGS